MMKDSSNRTTSARDWARGWPRIGGDARGFTMVELMVAVVLLGLISGVIWSLFSSTSGAMQEADSMADTLDRSRFALEQVSGDVRSAGAFASPDSDEDPWTLPRSTSRRVVGLASYNGWQDQRPYDAEVLAEHEDDSGDATIGFDGFFVIGALDYSTTFELRDMQFTGSSGGATSVPGFAIGARIPMEAVDSPGRFAERGLKKLVINDPFYTETGVFGTSPSDFSKTHNMIEPIYDNFGSRLIRVMDRQGFVQFGAFASDDPAWNRGIDFSFEQPGLQTKTSGRPFGLQQQAEGSEDVGYEAALIDAYWYHVEEDPQEKGNFQLVRDRIDADHLTTQLAGDWSSISESNLLTSSSSYYPSGGDRQRTVIADRVVDFQVWFDCATSAGNLNDISWHNDWVPPAGDSDPKHDCLDPSDPAPGRARVAHIRLSLRTEHERPELGHQAFLDEEGNYDASRPLQTFDLNPDSPGATRVVTVQSDIELTNFSYKNITR